MGRCAGNWCGCCCGSQHKCLICVAYLVIAVSLLVIITAISTHFFYRNQYPSSNLIIILFTLLIFLVIFITLFATLVICKLYSNKRQGSINLEGQGEDFDAVRNIGSGLSDAAAGGRISTNRTPPPSYAIPTRCHPTTRTTELPRFQSTSTADKQCRFREVHDMQNRQANANSLSTRMGPISGSNSSSYQTGYQSIDRGVKRHRDGSPVYIEMSQNIPRSVVTTAYEPCHIYEKVNDTPPWYDDTTYSLNSNLNVNRLSPIECGHAPQRVPMPVESMHVQRNAPMQYEFSDAQRRAPMQNISTDAQRRASMQYESADTQRRAKMQYESADAQQRVPMQYEPADAQTRSKMQYESSDAQRRAPMQYDTADAQTRAKMQYESADAQRRALMQYKIADIQRSTPMQNVSADAQRRAPMQYESTDVQRRAPMQNVSADSQLRPAMQNESANAQRIAPMQNESAYAQQRFSMQNSSEDVLRKLPMRYNSERVPRTIPMQNESYNTPRRVPKRNNSECVPRRVPKRNNSKYVPRRIPVHNEYEYVSRNAQSNTESTESLAASNGKPVQNGSTLAESSLQPEINLENTTVSPSVPSADFLFNAAIAESMNSFTRQPALRARSGGHATLVHSRPVHRDHTEYAVQYSSSSQDVRFLDRAVIETNEFSELSPSLQTQRGQQPQSSSSSNSSSIHL